MRSALMSGCSPLQESLGDEVLAAIAEKLDHDFAEFVGGPAKAGCLIEPLGLLCQVDETTVRDAAVASITSLVRWNPKREKVVLGPDQLYISLVPLVFRLLCGSRDGWFPPRVSGCELIADAYRASFECQKAFPHLTLPVEELKKQLDPNSVGGMLGGGDPVTVRTLPRTSHLPACALRPVLVPFTNGLPAARHSLVPTRGTMLASQISQALVELYKSCCDPAGDAAVRRRAGEKMGDVATAFGPDITRSELVPLWCAMVKEAEQESIRVKTLPAAPKIFEVASLDEPANGSATLPGPLFVACASDKSWRVRNAVAQTLPDVVKAVDADVPAANETGVRAPSPQVTLAFQLFCKLLKEDSEAEVRQTAAAQAARAAQVFPAHLCCEELIPVIVEMLNNETVANRAELAGTLLEMAEPLGAEAAEATFISRPREDGRSLIKTLLDSNEREVRLAVIGRLEGLIGVLSLDKSNAILQEIRALRADANWRVRHAVLKLLPGLADMMDQIRFDHLFIRDESERKFDEDFEDGSKDNCALIRSDWVYTCNQLGQKYGSEWLIRNVVPIVLERAKDKDYKTRAVLLDAIAHLPQLHSEEVLESSLLQPALATEQDRVPNLRLLLALTMGVLRASDAISAETKQTKIDPCLEKLKSDNDDDVVRAATNALSL